MKTNVSPNSLYAYWSMRDAGELPEKELLVYNALLKHGKMTRERIAEVTGMKESSACGRVFKLMERGFVVGVANCINSKTDKLNEIVDLAPHRRAMHEKKKQATLFPELVAA